MTAFPLSPKNPLTKKLTGMKYFDPADGKSKPYNTGTVTAFIATSNEKNAAAADPSWSVACPYIPLSKGDYAIQIPASALTAALLDSFFGTPSPGGDLVLQSFTGVDSAVSLGGAEFGPAPTVVDGVMGILSNRAYAVSLASSKATAVWQAGVANAVIGVDLVVPGTLPYVVLRYTDASNFLFVEAVDGTLGLWSVVAGVSVSRKQVAYVPVAGDRLEVQCLGPEITVRVNGVDRFVAPGITANLAATQFGFGTNDLAARFDNLEIKTPPVPTPYLIVQEVNGFRVAQELVYVPTRAAG